MNRRAELAKNTLVIGLGIFSSKFITFFLLPIYTHFLSPDQFGLVDLAITYIALLAPLIAIQLDRGAFRHLIDTRGDSDGSSRVISNTLRIVLGSIIVALLIAWGVSQFISIPYMAFIAAAIGTNIFMTLFMQFARGLGRNSAYAVASITLALATISLVTCFVVFMNMGVSGVLLALIIANLTAGVYLFVALRLHQYISLGNSDPKLRRELLGFSTPLVPSAISWWTIQAADRTIISIVLGVTATGIYAAASRYTLIFSAFNTIFDLSWNESASMYINSKDRDKFFSDVYNTSFRLFGTLGLLLITVTPFVFHIIIGPEFQAASLLVPILITGAFFQAIVSQYSVIYIAKKITKKVLMTSISAATISLTLNLVLIHWIGLYAAPISMVTTFAVIGIWRHVDIKKYVTITFTGNLFIKLVVLYATVISLYYVDSLYVNILNLLIAVASFILLSREPAIAVAKKIIAKVRIA